MRRLFNFSECHPGGILTCEATGMDDYVIGSGALLTAGRNAAIAAATLHAQTDAGLAPTIKAALVDFESSPGCDLSKVLVVASGWNAARFRAAVIEPLLARVECTLADVLGVLAEAAATPEVHIFARWFPDDLLTAALAREGVTAVAHPLDAIHRAALISGQSYRRWGSPLHAA